MKHIGFDDSTVMNELIKIAHKEGLIKSADESLPAPKLPDRGLQPDVPLPPREDEEPSIPGMNADDKLECGCEPGGCADDADHKCDCPDKCDCKSAKKTAAASEKLYDVSGETGEQLVDKAHPGGGTKTELTHSKTDENLVETIVEQQKKDVEVAHSAPKGTYAALRDLYIKLSHMVPKEKLEGLANQIRVIATPEDYVADHLVLLAHNLDKAGHYKAANRVDEMLVDLKKKL